MKKFLLVCVLSILCFASAFAQTQSEEDRLWNLANSDTSYTEMSPEDRVAVMKLRNVSRADFDFKKQLLLSQTNSAMSQQVEELFKNSDNMSDEEFEAQIDKLAAQVPDFREKQQEYQAAKKAEQERKEREWEERLRQIDEEQQRLNQIDEERKAQNSSSSSSENAPAPVDPTKSDLSSLADQSGFDAGSLPVSNDFSNQNELDAGSIKIGDDLNPVDNTPTDINLTPEQQAVQDYIDQQEEELADGEKSLPKDPTQQYIEDKEDELAAGEKPLPYNPNAPVSPSGSGLRRLSNQNGLDAIPSAIPAIDSSLEGVGGVKPGSGALSTEDILGKPKTLDDKGNIVLGYDVQKAADTLNSENANADSAAAAQASIAGCSGDVFQQIQCKVLQFLSNLRTLAYVLAGFGLIMFAYAAIFNKVNWKHLSSIGMGLFLLAMMGPFIEYFSGNSSVTTALGYGNFMGDQFTYVRGSGAQAAVDESQIPDTSAKNNNTAQIISGALTGGASGNEDKDNEETSSNKIKFSIGDIINFGKSAIRTVKDVANVAKNTDWSLSNIGGIISNVENTISHNESGFDSISNLAQIAGGILGKGDFSQVDVNSELKTGQDAANRIQDLFSSKKTRIENRSKRAQGENTNKLSDWLDNLGDKINGNTAE